MTLFYIIVGLVLLQSAVSLRGGFRYLAFFRREAGAALPTYTPFASVIVPCRGTDQGIDENFAALFAQDYPAYEIVFVGDRREDPALVLAEELCGSLPGGGVKRARVVVAGAARESGQKVHNLRAAVSEADPKSKVFVFVDTDARPQAHWLRSLVAPLADAGTGAATGYRWFVPARDRLASHLRSVWNASIASALGADTRRNFCWGGSTAVRRETFERLGVAEAWRGALSDDYALTRTLRGAGLTVRFVPSCLTPSFEDCTFDELFEFTTRQLKITRIYAPHLWKMVLYSNMLFTLGFFGGGVVVAARAALGLPYDAPLALLCAIFLTGALKAFVRLRAVAMTLAPYHARLWRGAWAHLLLWPLTAALFLYNALAAARSHRITWRGITYELISPTETAIIR